MPKKNCDMKKNTRPPENADEVREGATQASYFVTENRDLSSEDLEKFETMLGQKEKKK